MDFNSIIISVVCLILSTTLFWKAAGGLLPNKLNIVSYVYYIFMLQTYIGTSLIALGFDKHYTLNYLIQKEKSCQITFCIVIFISIVLPLFILLFEKMMRIDIKNDYQKFLDKSTECDNENTAFILLASCSVAILLLLVGFLVKIGYVPLLRLVKAPEGFDFALERVRISSLYFVNPYITNLFILSGIPLLAYVVFSYAIVAKKWKWFVLSVITFGASIIVKTYKFEKSPVLLHLVIFFLIILYHYNKKVKFLHVILLGIFLCVGIGLMYILTGFEGRFFDIYNGPLGRTLFTQVGTLTYSFDLFSEVFPFLNGRSFSPTILKLLGMDSTLHLRSAKIIMAYYGSEKVYDGSAGVMNSMFAGEAYANFGYLGIIISVIWIALYITVIMYVILKLKKTSVTVVYLALMTERIGSMSQGGFADFVYSFYIIFITVALLGLYWLVEKEGINSIKKRVLRYGKKLKK